MTDETRPDDPLQALHDQLGQWGSAETKPRAGEVLRALADPIAQAQAEAARLESEDKPKDALEYYEAIAAAFAEGRAVTVEDEQADLASVTDFWELIAESKREAIATRVPLRRLDRKLTKPNPSDPKTAEVARRDKYPARSSSGLTPPIRDRDKGSFDRSGRDEKQDGRQGTQDYDG